MQTQNRRENHPKQVVDVDKMFVCFLNSKCVIDKHFSLLLVIILLTCVTKKRFIPDVQLELLLERNLLKPQGQQANSTWKNH